MQITRVEATPKSGEGLRDVRGDVVRRRLQADYGITFSEVRSIVGFLISSDIDSNFTKINKPDTSSMVKSFVGNLGPDSAHVHYFFADSGFWKVEIDFVIHDLSVEKQVQTFLRHEKNISEVYGPPSKINHKESGVSSAYSNLLDQRFSNAFYRSSWKAEPAVIELYLNSSVLLPKSDVSIFSGNYSILKLVYYNPDYMYSSSPAPPSQELSKKPAACPAPF